MTTSLENVLQDLQRLRVSYESRGLLATSVGSRSTGGSAPSPLARDLLLADALLRNVVGRQVDSASSAADPPDQPVTHYAVFGGTQVGKSTVMNVLAGREIAHVHHTAGFTRHAQGFTPPGITPDQALKAFPRAFPAFDRVPRETLSLDRPREYSLQELTEPTIMGRAVLWDSPDCDAVDSSVFQQGFVETVTLSDAIVYVTSREKYAVNAVLAWVVRLIRAGVPVIAVINMVPRQQQAELIADMQTALARVADVELNPGTTLPEIPILAFEYVADGDVTLLYDQAYTPAANLRSGLQASAAATSPSFAARQDAALAWISEALPSILQPALHDLDAWQQWDEQLNRSLKNFVADYRRYYIDDPNRYDAFSRVGLEILQLLNPPIPGLQKTLAAVRTVVSLPARAILFGGKAIYRYASSGGKGFSKPEVVPHEIATYREAHNRLLNDLARYLEQRRRSGGEGQGDHFWAALDSGWETRVPVIEDEFRTSLKEHQVRSDQYVREAAEAIYKELERDPVKLNMLRSSRIAADAAAIVVSVKTGGPGDIIHDIVVAPALMSVVEAATRHIAGNYVEHRKEKLRDQLITDTARFADEVYGERLRDLARQSLKKFGLDVNDADNIRSLGSRIEALRQEVKS